MRKGDSFEVRVGPDESSEYTLGPDIDLETEVVVDARGERITQARVEEMVREARQEHSRRAGRPSLSAPAEHSPHVSFRVPTWLARRAEAVAAREGKSLAELGREALKQYLDRAG